MQITKRTKDQFVILAISGSLDLNNIKPVKEIFEDEIKKGTKYVVIDMKELAYIDSSGIGSFIGLMSKLRQIGGQVILMNMSPEIERIFSMTKLLAFFKVFKTEQDFIKAIPSFARSGGQATKKKDDSSNSSGSSPGYIF
ncbi:MAG: STAS domain-containing protein [Spirochaetes bacterium]|nr:STAS domain-containing protein [Spirochaetota bacterium]